MAREMLDGWNRYIPTNLWQLISVIINFDVLQQLQLVKDSVNRMMKILSHCVKNDCVKWEE